MADFDKNLQPIIKETGYKGSPMPIGPGMNFSSGGGGGVSDLSQKEDVFAELEAAGQDLRPKGLFISNAELEANKRYKTFNPTIGDYEDFAAQGQEWYKQAANGVLKGANLAATTVAGGFGMLYGVGKATLFTQKLSDIWDNEIMRGLDKWNEKVDNEYLPNYYTAAERNAEWYSFDNWFTTNFLFDKLIKNSGYAVGAMVGGNIANAGLLKAGSFLGKVASSAATAAEASQAFKLFTPLLRNTSRAFSAGKNIEAASILESQISSIADLSAKSSQLANIAKQTGQFARFSDAARRTAVATYSSAGEASFEALQSAKEFRENLIEEFTREKGYAPTGEDLKNINMQAENVGKTAFFGNMALLTVTEFNQLPYLIGSNYSASRQAANSLLGKVDDFTKDAAGNYVAKTGPKTKFGKLYEGTKRAGSYVFDPKESAQEVLQYGLQVGTQNYFKKAQEGGEADLFVDGFLYGLFGKDEFGEGVGALVSKEGIEGGILGGITGGGMQALRNIGKNKALAKNTESFLSMLNGAPTFKDAFKQRLDAANRGVVLQQQHRDAILNGDKLEAKDLENDLLHTYLSPRIKYGRFDMVMEDLNELKQAGMTEQGLAELKQQGMANINDDVNSFQKRISSIENSSKALNDLYQSLNIRYAGETMEVNGEIVRKYPPVIIDMLAYAGSKIANYDVRIPQLNTKLTTAGINTQAILQDIIQTGVPNAEATKEALNMINSMDVTSDVKDELKGTLDDVIELSLRRKMFISEYDGIKNNPLNYERPEEEVDDVDVRQKEGRKKVTKTLEVGRTYSLEEPIRLEKGKIILAPKFTVLSSTLGGEFEVQLPDGTTTFFSPEQFDQYKISEEDNTSQELENTLNQSINDVLDYPAFKGVVEKPEEGVNKLEYINSLGNQKLTKAVINRFNKLSKEYFDKMSDNKKVSEEIKKQKDDIDNQQNEFADSSTDPKVEVIDFDTYIGSGETGPLKTAADFFRATLTESEQYNDPTKSAPHVTRSREFLNNARKFKNRDKLRAIVFTKNQEDALGLSGVTQLSYGAKWDSNKDKVNDIDTGFVAAVFIEVEGKNRYFVDKDGKRLTPVGQQVDLGKVVFQTMPTTEIIDSKGNDRFRSATPGEKEEFLANRNQWVKDREILFNLSADALPTSSFFISKGFPRYTEKKNGEYVKNKVSDTLMSEDGISNNSGILKISTGTPIVHNGENMNAKAGLVYFQDRDTLQVLNNNRLGVKKGKVVYEVIKSMITEMESQALAGKKVQLDRQKLRYLRSVLIYAKPEGDLKSNQLWIDIDSLSIKLGSNTYSFEDFKTKEKDVVNTLSGTYHSANKKVLDKNEEYLEFVMEGDQLSTKTWDTYQEYLLSGTDRTVDEIPFVTNLRKPTEALPYNFAGKYAVLQNLSIGQKNSNFKPVEQEKEKEPVKPPVVKPDASSVPDSTPVKFGSIEFNTGSPTVLKIRDIEFEYNLSYSEESGLKVAIVESEKNNKNLQTLIDSLTDEQIDKARVAYELSADSTKAEVVNTYILKEGTRLSALEIVKAKQQAPPTAPQAPVSDIEAKKADIERRRKEELTVGKKSTPSLSYFTKRIDTGSLAGSKVVSPKNPREYYIGKTVTFYKNNGDPVTITVSGELGATQKMIQNVGSDIRYTPMLSTDGKELGTFENVGSAIDNIEEINSRYDAELAALEGTKPTETKTPPAEEKPAEEAPKPKKNRFKSGYKDTRMEAASEATAEKTSDRDIEAFKAWAKKNVPNIPYEILDRMITINKNEKAWGVFENGVAKFFKKGLRGTEYHEVFEGIWKGFLSEEERSALLNEFKNKPGFFVDRESGQQILFTEATDRQAKERIADDFADFRLGKLPARSLSERIKRFFKAIVDFFKSFVTKPSLKEDLFNSIESGKFREYTLPESIVTEQPEYRKQRMFPDGEIMSQDEAHELIQDMTISISEYLFNRGNDDTVINVFDQKKVTGTDAYNYIREVYEENGNLEGLGEDLFNDLYLETLDTLRTIGVSINPESVVSINDENGTNRIYSPEAFEVDFKKNMKFAIKYLIATQPAAEKEYLKGTIPKTLGGKYNSDLKMMMNFNKTFATLLSNLSGVPTNKVPTKLKELVVRDGNYYRIARAIRMNIDNGTFDLSEFDKNDIILYIQFMQAFNKSKPDVVVEQRTVTDKGVEVYSKPADRASAINVEKYSWLSNVRALSNDPTSLIVRRKNRYYINTASDNFPKEAPSNTKDRLSFLAKIGIKMPSSGIIEKNAFVDIVNRIHKYGSDEAFASADKFLKVDGQIARLAEMYVISMNPDQETTRLNVENKRSGTYTDSNAVSVFEEDFNDANNLEELFQKRPELKDPFSANSLLVKKGGLFFNSKGDKIKGRELKVGAIEGVSEDGEGTMVANLTEGKRFTVEINQNLNGNYYILIPADSSTERTLNLGNYISFEDIGTPAGNKKLFDLFSSYLNDEVDLALDWRNRSKLAATASNAKQLRFFKDILDPSLVAGIESIIENETDSKIAKVEIDKFIKSNQSQIEKSILDTIDYLNNSLKVKLQNLGEVNFAGENTYSYENLNSDFANKHDINKSQISEEDYNRLLTFVNINQAIANIEMHKFIFGDPYQFEIKNGKLDEPKRIKSWLSPRRKSIDSEDLNNRLNKIFDSAGEIKLANADKTKHNFKSFLKTVTLTDPQPFSRYISNFENYKEADGFSVISLGAYKEAKIKTGDNWSQQAEDWYQWQMAYARQKLASRTDKYKYTYKNKALEKQDAELIQTPAPAFVTEVLKPIVSGAKPELNRIEAVIDKYSQMPIYMKAVEGTQLEDFYAKMLFEGIDYAVYKSGRKEGTRSTYNMYVGGKLNTAKFDEESIENISWKTYGIQVENSYEEKDQTRGSQLMKNASMDMFENGKAVMNGALELYEESLRIHNEFHQQAYNEFLEKLGIEDLGTSFAIKDAKKVSETLEYELLRRDASMNVIDTIRLDENGQFRIPFEASSAYEEIRSVLFSIVNKSLLSPGMSGKPHVQAPVTGWENKAAGRKLLRQISKGKVVEITQKEYEALSDKDKKSVVLASDTLKFYENKDGERYMEVMIPNYWKKYFPDMTDAQVLEYLNRPENQKILFGVGFRIPHQAMSSTEVFKVKGFLDPGMGSTVVVPSEIVEKAGSDFDIDKLNMYLKSVYLDENRNVKLIEYKGSKQATLDFYGSFYEKTIGKQLDEVYRKQETRNKLIKIFEKLDQISEDVEYTTSEIRKALGKDLMGYYLANESMIEDIQDQADAENLHPITYLEKQIERFDQVSEQMREKMSGERKKKYAEKMYKKSLENQYYDLLERMVSLPDNFDRLMSKISDAGLPDVAKELDIVRNESEASLKNKLISKSFLTSLRHAFVLGKKWVGIAAVNITGHSIAQKINAYIDPKKLGQIDKYDAQFLGNLSLSIPHNKTIVDGKEMISLGGRTVAYTKKDKDGNDIVEFISDRLSGYATAFVDVAKDPYILKIIQSDLVVGTALFMERIGMGELSAYFINQPIIIDYLKYLDKIGSRALFSKTNTLDIILDYPVKAGTPAYDLKNDFPTDANGVVDFEKSKASLLSSIDINAERTDEFNAKQQAVFKEFLKIAKMAQYSFKFTQAYNYDTTRVRTTEGLLRKTLRTETAEDANIISSINDVFDQTFIGEQKRLLINEVKALSSVFKLDADKFYAVIDDVIRPYAMNEYMSLDDFDRIVKRIKTSFIDYLVQTKSNLLQDATVKSLLLGKNSVANRLVKMQNKYPAMELLQNFEPRFSKQEEGAGTVSMKVKPSDAPTTNRYIESMRELKALEPQFYKDLIMVNLLQGSYDTRVSINKIVPLEDRAEILTPLINNNYSIADIKNFATDAMFARTNFSDDQIVPIVDVKLEINDYGGLNYAKSGFVMMPELGATLGNGKVMKLSKQYERFNNSNMDLIKTRRYKYAGGRLIKDITKPEAEGGNMLIDDYNQAVLDGVINPYEMVGYKKVKDETGAAVEDDKGNIYFKMVNLYGDRDIVKEYRTDGKPSIFPNGTYSVAQEISDNDIIREVNGEVGQAPIVISPVEEIVETTPSSTDKVERSTRMINRSELRKNTRTLYLFGDNDARKGLGGQAKEMRNEPNAIGISTKKLPATSEQSYKTDAELDQNKKIITDDINKVIAAWDSGKYDKLVIPEIGTGLAELPTRAPQTYAFLQQELKRLENYINGNAQQVVTPVAPVAKVQEVVSTSTNKFNKKNIFSVVSQQGAVDRKAAIKASIATQYIGFGEGILGSQGGRSSTEIYREQAGQYANTGNYSANDIIFVSIPGKRGAESVRKVQQDKTINEAIKALEAGATILTDNKSYIDSSSYNEGERRLYKTLLEKGYTYSEITEDGQVIGTWTKSSSPVTPVQQPAQVVSQTATPSKSLPTLSLQPDNVEKVKNGTKNITNRKDALSEGMYKLPDGTVVNLTSLGRFKVIPGKEGVSILNKSGVVIGSMPKDEFAQREGFKDWADFTANNKYSSSFINDGQIRNVYSIELATPSTTETIAPVEQPTTEVVEEQLSATDIAKSTRIGEYTVYEYGDGTFDVEHPEDGIVSDNRQSWEAVMKAIEVDRASREGTDGETTTDEYKYYGRFYTIVLDAFGNPIDVLGYKGKASAKQQLLDSYKANPNVDPQTPNTPFRGETGEIVETVEEAPVAQKSTFTYKGRSIETEFELTNSQREALEKLIDFSMDPKAEFITLQGAAGTGKTSVIGYLDKYMKNSHKFNYFAPTHAATAELAFATVKTGNKNLPMTVASGFSTSFDAATGTQVSSLTKKVQERLGLRNNVFVVDEVSMLNSKDYEGLKGVTSRSKIKVIFMGDVMQIPEVDTKNPEKKLVSKAFTEHNQVVLSEVKRTRSESIKNMLSNIRENINNKIPVVESSGELEYLPIGDFNAKIAEVFEKDPEETVLISYTNRGVTEYNQKIRSTLGRVGNLTEGDIIVGYLGYSSKQIEKQNIANSVRYTVKSVQKNGSIYRLGVSSKKLKKLADMGVVGANEMAYGNYLQLSRSDAFDFSDLTEADFEKNNKQISYEMESLYEAKMRALQSKKAFDWVNYFDAKKRVSGFFANVNLGDTYIYNPQTKQMEKYNFEKHKSIGESLKSDLLVEKGIDFGHAVTIHKSQGSTVRNVFFDASSLPSSTISKLIMNGKEVNTEKHALLYVGVSRASEYLGINYSNASNFYNPVGGSLPQSTPTSMQTGESYVPSFEESDAPGESAQGVRRFYSSLTDSQKLKLGSLESILEEYNELPAEISENSFIEILMCRL